MRIFSHVSMRMARFNSCRCIPNASCIVSSYHRIIISFQLQLYSGQPIRRLTIFRPMRAALSEERVQHHRFPFITQPYICSSAERVPLSSFSYKSAKRASLLLQLGHLSTSTGSLSNRLGRCTRKSPLALTLHRLASASGQPILSSNERAS